jgi:hypothetical protein
MMMDTMDNNAEAIRLLRHIRVCLVIVACCGIFGILMTLFPEFVSAYRIAAVVLFGFMALLLTFAGLAISFSKAASAPARIGK